MTKIQSGGCFSQAFLLGCIIVSASTLPLQSLTSPQHLALHLQLPNFTLAFQLHSLATIQQLFPPLVYVCQSCTFLSPNCFYFDTQLFSAHLPEQLSLAFKQQPLTASQTLRLSFIAKLGFKYICRASKLAVCLSQPQTFTHQKYRSSKNHKRIYCFRKILLKI